MFSMFFKTSLRNVLLLAVWATATAHADMLYASLSDGSLNAVAMFTPNLTFVNQVTVAGQGGGVAAGAAGQFYVASGNTIYKYADDGTELGSVTGSGTTVTHDISYGNSMLYAGFTDGSLNGVAEFSASLGFISQPSTLVTNGIAAGLPGQFYLGSGNTINLYSDAGTVLNTVTGSATTVDEDVSFSGTNVFVAFQDGTLFGVAIFTPTLGFVNQLTTLGPAEGLAAGDNNDFYIAVGNTIYHYSNAGAILGSIAGSPTTVVSDLSFFQSVPEPAQWITLSFGLLLLRGLKRRSAATR